MFTPANYVPRTIEPLLARRLFAEQNKVIILYGQRQVGKTTLVNQLLEQRPELRVLRVNADLSNQARVLQSRDIAQLRLFLTGFDVLFIDEAQRIPDIGLHLKIIHDHFPSLRVIVTGSSAFELANQIQEPLTGRAWTFLLHPFSVAELSTATNLLDYAGRLEEWLIYGKYPGVLQQAQAQEKQTYLIQLTKAYLYKDLLDLAQVKQSNKLKELLQLLALQLGQEVSLHEIAKQLHLDSGTVARYIDLLEKCFILRPVRGFSRNERKEITKKQKIYFYDLGIRNALIERFAPLALRDDVGALWENFLVMERYKYLTNNELWAQQFFWRLQSGAKIDYVEVFEGKPSAYEFKYRQQIEQKPPMSWLQTYPEARFATVHLDNWIQFLLGLPPYAPQL